MAVSFSIPKCSFFAVSVTTIALTFCIIYSLLFDYERVMYNDFEKEACDALNKTLPINYLPSVTNCFSKYWPQTWIMMIGMSFPIWPRFVALWFYYDEHSGNKMINCSSFSEKIIKILSHLAFYGDMFELVAMILVIYITKLEDDSIPKSSEQRRLDKLFIGYIHLALFTCFILAGTVYITCTYLLHSRSNLELFVKYLSLKRFLLFLYIISEVGVISSQYYEIAYPCTDYIGTIFSISEYIFLYTIMFYHMIQACEYKNYKFTLHGPEGISSKQITGLKQDKTQFFKIKNY